MRNSRLRTNISQEQAPHSQENGTSRATTPERGTQVQAQQRMFSPRQHARQQAQLHVRQQVERATRLAQMQEDNIRAPAVQFEGVQEWA